MGRRDSRAWHGGMSHAVRVTDSRVICHCVVGELIIHVVVTRFASLWHSQSGALCKRLGESEVPVPCSSKKEGTQSFAVHQACPHSI
jgi:hypothetical protein